MSIAFVSPVFGPATLYFNSDRLDATRPAPTFSRDPGESLKPLLARVVELRRYLEDLKDALKRESLPTPSKSAVRSQSVVTTGSTQNLGLNLTATAASLVSTEQVNTLPTSFSPRGPAFNGSSTSLPTVGGVYDGSDNDEILTFNVKNGGNVGGPYTGKQGSPADLRIEVRRENGSKLDDINFNELTLPDTVFTLQNGLTISFSAGSLVEDESFTVDTFTSIPSSVDPDKPMDGTRNDNPNFEPGFLVSPGSFKVNNSVIAVNAGDSINAVLSRINASAAGVTAVFDAGTETIRLTHNSPGATGQINLSDDTSGFLAATKLAGATAVAGTDNDLDRPIGQVAAFAGIQSGDFTVNNVTFTVDTSTDTLNGLLQAINVSQAGVTAVYQGDRIEVTANAAGSPVTLTDGTSGFFTGARVTPGVYEPTVLRRAAASNSLDTRSLARLLKEGFDEVGERMKGLFDRQGSELARSETSSIRSSFFDAIRGAFKGTLNHSAAQFRNKNIVESNLGLAFTLDDSARYIIHTSESDFRSALESSPQKLMDFIFSEASAGGKDGVLSGLIKTLQTTEGSLSARTGATTGLFLDALA